MKYKVSYFDVSFNCLQKHGRIPYSVFNTGSFETAVRDAALVSDETGLCVRVENMETGEKIYYENGCKV